jgi:hypothetical protein
MEDWLLWVIVVVCFGVTVAVQAEVALLFIGAGALGSLYYGAMLRARTAPTLPLARRNAGGSGRVDGRAGLDLGRVVTVSSEGRVAHLRQWSRDRALRGEGVGPADGVVG